MINLLYILFKFVLKEKNDITFLSRQSNEISEDFLSLKNELFDYNINTICIRDDGNILSKIKLVYFTFISVFYLAKSKVCVLDSYWPAISFIKDDDLKVIQMWHSIGKIKKSGYQTIGNVSGRGAIVSKIFKMHSNYDIVIAGAEAFNDAYIKSFNIKPNVIRNFGLPRIDRLIENNIKYKEDFLTKYPNMSNKPIILYAPTFRRGYEFDFNSLLFKIDTSKFNVIFRPHPNSKVEAPNNIKSYNEFSTEIVLSVCDYLITDYSAIALEGAILNKKTFYYINDYDEYMKNNGFNLDIAAECPKLCYKNAECLIKDIENGNYAMDEFINYKNKFLPSDLGESTNKIVSLVCKFMEN